MVPSTTGVIANSPVLANVRVDLFQGEHGGTLTEAACPLADFRGADALIAIIRRCMMTSAATPAPVDVATPGFSIGIANHGP